MLLGQTPEQVWMSFENTFSRSHCPLHIRAPNLIITLGLVDKSTYIIDAGYSGMTMLQLLHELCNHLPLPGRQFLDHRDYFDGAHCDGILAN